MPAAQPESGGGRTLQLTIAANYAGQVFVGLVGIVMVPAYLHLMHAEAYALVGFYALLQVWSQLLDLGLSATVSREAARHAGGTLALAPFRALLRSFEWLFWPLGLLLAAGLVLAAPLIAQSWLDARALPAHEVRLALQLMAGAVALRWIGSLYRGVLVGAGRQLWLNGFSALVVSLRFIGVVPVLLAVDAGPVVFFSFQLAVSVLELGMLARAAYRMAPLPPGTRAPGSWSVLRPALRFSAGIGISTVVWVVVTQADKLVLSGVLPLADYGYFTAAVTAAGAISMLGIALAQALQPALTQLAEQPGTDAIYALYRRATQWTVVLCGPLSLVCVFFAEPLLWAWTGNAAFARDYAPVLALYAAGNALAALGILPYSLQYARGDLRLHARGNIVFAVVLVPAVLYVARVHGAVGSGWVWLVSNAAFFLFWTPLVHRRFAPGLHGAWLRRDVLLPLAPALLIGLGVAATLPWSSGRVETVLRAAAAGLAMTAGALALSDGGRVRLHPLCRRWLARLPWASKAAPEGRPPA